MSVNQENSLMTASLLAALALTFQAALPAGPRAVPPASADPLHNTVMFDRSRFGSITDCLNAAARVHVRLEACGG
jgi:hypothetical protein